jgi:hypothetical protein
MRPPNVGPISHARALQLAQIRSPWRVQSRPDRHPTGSQRCRHRERGTQSAQCAAADQHEIVGCEPAHQRPGRKQPDAGDEQAAATVGVAKSSTSQQETCIGEIVGIDNPLQPAHARAQRGTDLPESQVDDRGIELRQKHADARDDQHARQLRFARRAHARPSIH